MAAVDAIPPFSRTCQATLPEGVGNWGAGVGSWIVGVVVGRVMGVRVAGVVGIGVEGGGGGEKSQAVRVRRSRRIGAIRGMRLPCD